METHGPLGTLWVGLGLGAFYIALIWINSLLGFFTTPLFIVPMTWVQDMVNRKAHHHKHAVRETHDRVVEDQKYPL